MEISPAKIIEPAGPVPRIFLAFLEFFLAFLDGARNPELFPEDGKTRTLPLSVLHR